MLFLWRGIESEYTRYMEGMFEQGIHIYKNGEIEFWLRLNSHFRRERQGHDGCSRNEAHDKSAESWLVTDKKQLYRCREDLG